MSSIVAELASERGVSERTVWRLVARARREGKLIAAERDCDRCGKALPKRSTVRRRFCSDSCRARWHQSGALTDDERAAAAAGPLPSVEGERSERDIVRQQAAREMLDYLEGRWPTPRDLDELADQNERFRRLARIMVDVLDEIEGMERLEEKR